MFLLSVWKPPTYVPGEGSWLLLAMFSNRQRQQFFPDIADHLRQQLFFNKHLRIL